MPNPKPLVPAGYAALVKHYALRVPALTKTYATGSTQYVRQQPRCTVLAPRYASSNDVRGQLTFALKYEGIQLHILRPLFQQLDSSEIVAWVKVQPTGAYSRRIWFLYEWLMDCLLPLDD